MLNETIIDILKNDYSKEFIVAIISGLSLLILQLLYKYLKNIKQYSKFKGYIGEYYTYTVSTKESRSLSCYKYTIKYSFGKLVFISNNKGLKYNGEVLITDKNIYFYAKGANHDEYTHMIFHKPLNNKLLGSIGVFSGVSIKGEPSSKIILISNKKIDTYKAKKILQDTDINHEKLLNVIPMIDGYYTGDIIK